MSRATLFSSTVSPVRSMRIVTQVRQCHNDRSIAIIEQLFKGEKNVYTITKKGQEKLIYQAPWTVDGVVKGLVELSMVIPKSMPHYDRDKINPSTSDQ